MDQILQMGADILLGAGAFGAAIYCAILARRLRRFNNLENGVGGAVAVLSAQVDDMTRTLDLARKAAGHSSATLTALTERAEAATRKLELMMAALHDLPEAPVAPAASRESERDAEWMRAAAGRPEEPPLFASRRQPERERAG